MTQSYTLKILIWEDKERSYFSPKKWLGDDKVKTTKSKNLFQHTYKMYTDLKNWQSERCEEFDARGSVMPPQGVRWFSLREVLYRISVSVPLPGNNYLGEL